MKRRIFLVWLVLAVVVSCAKKEDDTQFLSRKKFTSLLIQMHILEADFSFNQRLDQASIEKSYLKYDELFKKSGTDSTIVSNTFEHYKDKQQELLDIYRDVLDSLNKMAMESQTITKKPQPVSNAKQ